MEKAMSLPLYEGVDWNLCQHGFRAAEVNVSLFTREWIEIPFDALLHPLSNVSLFTREWIEMHGIMEHLQCTIVSLFTREWIEIQPCR